MRDHSGAGSVPYIPLTEDEVITTNGDRSIGALVRDASQQVSTLVRAEVELAKSELVGEVKKGVRGSIFFVIALVVLLYSSFFFFFFLADLLDIWLPRSAASGIVFALMLLVAGVCAFLGWRKVKKIRPPERTIESFKETSAALKRKPAEPELPAGAPSPGQLTQR